MNCSRCDKTDGLAYASNPPKVRCTIDGKFHFGTDDCSIEFVPVVHGRWERRSDCNGFLRCSNCRDVNIAEEWLDDGKWSYCPNCGAHMDLEDKYGR